MIAQRFESTEQLGSCQKRSLFIVERQTLKCPRVHSAFLSHTVKSILKSKTSLIFFHMGPKNHLKYYHYKKFPDQFFFHTDGSRQRSNNGFSDSYICGHLMKSEGFVSIIAVSPAPETWHCCTWFIGTFFLKPAAAEDGRMRYLGRKTGTTS